MKCSEARKSKCLMEIQKQKLKQTEIYMMIRAIYDYFSANSLA